MSRGETPPAAREAKRPGRTSHATTPPGVKTLALSKRVAKVPGPINPAGKGPGPNRPVVMDLAPNRAAAKDRAPSSPGAKPPVPSNPDGSRALHPLRAQRLRSR